MLGGGGDFDGSVRRRGRGRGSGLLVERVDGGDLIWVPVGREWGAEGSGCEGVEG